MSVKPITDAAKPGVKQPANAGAPVHQVKPKAGVGSSPSSIQQAPAKKPEDKTEKSSGLKHSVYYDSFL
jgi:hypothetical protein